MKFCVRALNWAERMKQTSQAEQPNVPPPARLPPKSTTPPAAAKPLTLKDVRGKRPAKDAEQRPTKNPAWANSSLARALTTMTKAARQDMRTKRRWLRDQSRSRTDVVARARIVVHG